MPEMRKETAAATVSVNLGDVQVDIAPVTAGTVKERSWKTSQSVLTLPGGAYSVQVRHIDPQGGEFTANGEAFGFNRYYERSVREDQVNNTQDFTPEVDILNPEGRELSITVSYPSSSPVNPSAL